jgi:hypothetical protein
MRFWGEGNAVGDRDWLNSSESGRARTPRPANSRRSLYLALRVGTRRRTRHEYAVWVLMIVSSASPLERIVSAKSCFLLSLGRRYFGRSGVAASPLRSSVPSNESLAGGVSNSGDRRRARTKGALADSRAPTNSRECRQLPRRQLGTTDAVLGRTKRACVDVVSSDHTVQPRTIDPEQIGRGLLVPAGMFESAFDKDLLHLFERHIRRHFPGNIC